MNLDTYLQMQEDEAFGRFLLETIAEIYECEPNPAAIDRAVYKTTDCGAWCRFDEHGILVGTIVEGSEAEYSERIDLSGIDIDDAGAALLCSRFRCALDAAEAFADEVLASSAD